MLGIALIMLWLRLWGAGLRPLLAQAVLSVSGYLRPRPDAKLESALRSAFTQLDEELAAVLSDRPVPLVSLTGTRAPTSTRPRRA